MRYWEELLANHPRIAIGITRSLGRHITDVHARIAELATEEVEQRVAHAVLRLATRPAPRSRAACASTSRSPARTSPR